MSINDNKRQILDEALKNNQAFILDWKFTVEDIIFNIKSILPQFSITALPEKQVYGDWKQSMIVDDREYSFDSESPTLILDTIAAVNTHLQKNGQTLIHYDTQDDDYSFILINLKDLPKYLDLGFKKI